MKGKKDMTPQVQQPEFAERHYSIPEIAKMWSMGANTVRRLFRNVPGVVTITSAETGRVTRRKGRTTQRVPQSVLERVYRGIRSGGN